MSSHLLWYFADPMCSWCWGFTPVLDAIKERYGGRIKVALVLGGLRPGTTEPLTPAFRREILHHWHAVHLRTGQPFRFEGALPDGFVYDTEPPSRAVVAVGVINPDAIFPYFKRVQTAFYAEGQDVTDIGALAALAQEAGVAADRFRETFAASATRDRTQRHFEHARKAGVNGFPTTVLQRDDRLQLLSTGYRPIADLETRIDAWLAD